MFKFFLSTPLLGYLLAVFNGALFLGDPDKPLETLNTPLLEFTVPSSANIVLTVSSVFILTGIVFLYFEILKSTRSSTIAIVDHGLSMLVFVFFLVEFVAVEMVGNSTFLILTLMALVDVIAGFTVSISTARRDISLT